MPVFLRGIVGAGLLGLFSILLPARSAAVEDLSTWSSEAVCNAGFGEQTWQLVSASEVRVTDNQNCSSFLRGGIVALDRRIQFTAGVDVVQADGDYWGFALGFDPGDITNPNANFLVVQWQGDDGTPGGISLTRVTGTCLTGDEIPNLGPCADEIARATLRGDSPWVHGRFYAFDVTFTEGRMTMFVDDLGDPGGPDLEFDVPGSFGDGGFAFYNFGQADTVYRDVTVSQLPATTLRPGDALVASLARGQGLVRVDPATGAQTVVLDSLAELWGGLALGGSGLLVSRPGPPDVADVEPATRAETLVTTGGSLAAAAAIAVEAPDAGQTEGDVLVAAAAGLLRVDPISGAQSPATQTALAPVGVAVEANGDILVTDGGDLVRVDPTDGSEAVVCSGLGSPAALAVGTSGELFVLDGASVVQAGAGDCTTLLTSGGNLVAPVDLDVEASGDLLVADAGPPERVIRVGVPSGVQSVLSSAGDLSGPVAIVVVPQSMAVVHPGDDPVSVPMLEGLGTPGGLEVTVNATEAGPLTADYETKTPQEQQDCIVTGTCPPPDFAVPGGSETQHWQIDFGGLFQGLATLVFRYDEALLGAFPELRLAVYHFVKGAWKRLTVIDRDIDLNTITVEVPAADGFSPFALGVEPACQDGEDNDGDTLVDLSDGGCTDDEDHSEVFDCSDGINNDADGLVDWPADPGCTGAGDPLETQDGRICDDGDDDDGDDLPDYRSDPGCKDALAMREDPACDDGIDNDNDGGIDWDGTPPDAQCFAAWRNRERPSGGCGLGGELVLILGAFLALRGLRRRRSSRCRGTTGDGSIAASRS